MGLDLTLYPDRWWPHLGDTKLLAHTTLDLEQDYRLFSRIDDIGRGDYGPAMCKPRLFDRVLWVYEDEGLREHRTDPYDSPLTYLTAGELVAVPTGSTTPWNQGVFAFMAHLPLNMPVVLWWH